MLKNILDWFRRDFGSPFLSVTSDDGMEFMRYKGGAISGQFRLRPEASSALEKRGGKLGSDYRMARRKLVDLQHMEALALNKKHMDALAELERGQRRRVMALFAEHVAWVNPDGVAKAA